MLQLLAHACVGELVERYLPRGSNPASCCEDAMICNAPQYKSVSKTYLLHCNTSAVSSKPSATLHDNSKQG
jgi:hypothetical protein